MPVTVDLVERQVRWRPTTGAEDTDEVHDFALDDYARWRLLEGLDDIDLTLRHTDEIGNYEASRKPWLPTLAS
jgi:3-isopropylmalate/(R)-2-methylmalate dehydratase small subunit